MPRAGARDRAAGPPPPALPRKVGDDRYLPRMDIFTIAVGLVTAAATLAAVWLAWKAGKASATATTAARQTAVYAKQTAEIAARAREADERWRGRQYLHELQQLVQMIRTAAPPANIAATWHCKEQSLLIATLQYAPEGLDLPECLALGQVDIYGELQERASAAEQELYVALLAVAGMEVFKPTGIPGVPWIAATRPKRTEGARAADRDQQVHA